MAKPTEKPRSIHAFRSKKNRRFVCSVYINDDVYEHIIYAARMATTSDSIQFFSVKEVLLAVFPVQKTVVIDDEAIIKS